MTVTKEYEIQQLDLAIIYYEKELEKAWSVGEVQQIEDNIKRLSSRLKELQCVY